MAIRPQTGLRKRWRGKVAKARNPDMVANDDDWLALVGKLGLRADLDVG